MPHATIPHVTDRVKPFPRRSQQKTLALVIAAITEGAQASSVAVAGHLALDWTEWHHDLRMLVAAVVVGCRAIPVQAAAFSKTDIPRSQTLRETTFLQLLVHTLRALEQATVVLCDRGFRRMSWLRHVQELRQTFVVRVVPAVIVDTGTKGRRLLRAWHLQPGQAVDLERFSLGCMAHLEAKRPSPKGS